MGAPKGTIPPAAGMGRPKGVPNKATKALKDAILGAFDEVGGQSYLVRVADEDPKTFCTLIGKVIPLQVAASIDGVVSMRWVKDDEPEPNA